MAHLNSAEGIQNMCATQIMTKSKSLRTGERLDVLPECITTLTQHVNADNGPPLVITLEKPEEQNINVAYY